MDPSRPTPRSTPQQPEPAEPPDEPPSPSPSAGPLIFRSPFDVVTEHASAELVEAAPQLPLTAPVPALWDVAVRRFSSPAYNGNRQRLTAHIDHARTAYARAFVAIQKSVRDVDAAGILTRSSEADLAQTALQVLGAQGGAGEKNKGRAAKFIDILHHYQGVFDVLSQAGDFNYLAVIWGGMKLMLMMAKNKRELLSRITDMLVDIGLTLSRIEVYSRLFPTARMVELVSMLYAAVADFLEEVIVALTQKSPFRKLLSSLVRPFDEKFGRAMERIRRLESCIEKDALLLHALSTARAASLAAHPMDTYLHQTHLATTLTAATPQANPLGPPSPLPLPTLLAQIKATLFTSLPTPLTTYHDSLAATYSVTARAWDKWFAVEQRHLPSSAAAPHLGSRLSQGLCDAPDHQHALQWLAQQRRMTPDVPSAYLIWAQGMTVQAAVASLVFQVLQQRPAAVVELGLGMEDFERAGRSVRRMWGLWCFLMRKLGGALVYLTIGSAGEDEFAMVERFVRTVREWDGPPIWVTMVHPYNERFVGIAEATDLDGLYDVHPSLTTTDALHHVLMLEMDVHRVSETIENVLWEAVWRETRYASVGISFGRVVDVVRAAAAAVVAADSDRQGLLDEAARAAWMAGVERWVADPVASNSTREVVQRHLDIVDLALPEGVRDDVGRHLKRLVLGVDERQAASLAARSMTQRQRHRVWDRMKAAIAPRSEAMFCTAIRDRVADALVSYCRDVLPGPGGQDQDQDQDHTQTRARAVVRLLNDQFGTDAGPWKKAMSLDAQIMAGGIAEAIMTGFAGTIEALLQPVVVEEEEDDCDDAEEALNAGGSC
ncbi:hypothetical protein C8A05DRAFT_16554 [Staphylotrichum tortipilum]|uniref:DUF7708 domain-containing protein n=1 Tax=Staphylotrichum tortipilum TaxID=2831512 RepID=A0AAN6RT71_9PEZI|nr:hypothetical protein C8A05DRAFT_16554 [Staphylotrichum longicolle]